MKYGDKLLFVLALTVLVTALIRFGISRSVTPEEPTPSIVFTQWLENYLEKDVLDELIKEFKDSHEGIEIVLNPVSYEDLHGELLGASDSQTFPGDLITLDTLWVPELLKRKTMEFHQGMEPFISFTNVFYYNLDILKEAGFSRPPKSRSEFIRYARALTSEEEGRWALSLGRNCSRGIYDDVFPWIWAAGAELIKDGKPAINSRPVIETLAFLASLENDGLMAPGGSSAGAEKKLTDFISGRAAFMIAPARDIEFVRKRMGDDAFSITTVPTPDNYAGKTYHASAGWTLGINSESAYKEEARLFAEFISGKAQALSEKLIPLNKAHDPFYPKLWDISIAGENAQDFAGLPWEELKAIFNEELSKLFAKQASPAETAGAIQKKWEDTISLF